MCVLLFGELGRGGRYCSFASGTPPSTQLRQLQFPIGGQPCGRCENRRSPPHRAPRRAMRRRSTSYLTPPPTETRLVVRQKKWKYAGPSRSRQDAQRASDDCVSISRSNVTVVVITSWPRAAKPKPAIASKMSNKRACDLPAVYRSSYRRETISFGPASSNYNAPSRILVMTLAALRASAAN